MKKIILLAALIAFSNTFGQMQTKFFAEDVKSIEYVTANFCEDYETQIREVTIIANKTTYKNESNIEQLRQYLLKTYYLYVSELKNNCNELTFEFINIKYENKSLNEEECKACKKFKTGIYGYNHILRKKDKIKRKETVQKEIYGKRKDMYYITWISDCHYILTYKKINNPKFNYLYGKEINVEIIDILDDGSYVYKSRKSFLEETNFGIIKKIK